MKKAVVRLGQTVNKANTNTEKLMMKARETVSAIVPPRSIQFAGFEHGGRRYALSAHLVIEVEELRSRVPAVVVRGR